jgi:RHS repeat-associated protein
VVTDNKQQVVDTVGSSTIGYTYDVLNRLTDANTTAGGTDHRSYVYDVDGNRTSQTVNGTNTTYTFNTADQATTTGYSFDADGNETATPALSNLTYNPLNQTTAITESGATTNFAYAGNGQDSRTTANSIDAALSSLGTDVENSGSTYHYYIRDPGGNLLAIVNDAAGALTTRYPVVDALGSVVALTNGTGTVEDTTKYDPYGIVLSHTGADYNPFGYAGGYTDSSTGLIHDGARYENPADGRFTQLDPAGQGPNVYAYASGNPTNYVDPSGLSWFSAIVTVVEDVSTASDISDLINTVDTSQFADTVASIAAGVVVEFACNAALAFGDVATAGAATVAGEALCFVAGSAASSAVG